MIDVKYILFLVWFKNLCDNSCPISGFGGSLLAACSLAQLTSDCRSHGHISNDNDHDSIIQEICQTINHDTSE